MILLPVSIPEPLQMLVLNVNTDIAHWINSEGSGGYWVKYAYVEML